MNKQEEVRSRTLIWYTLLSYERKIRGAAAIKESLGAEGQMLVEQAAGLGDLLNDKAVYNGLFEDLAQDDLVQLLNRCKKLALCYGLDTKEQILAFNPQSSSSEDDSYDLKSNNQYITKVSSVITHHPIYAFIEGEGILGSFSLQTYSKVTQSAKVSLAKIWVIVISGPQLRHDDIQYFAQASLIINGIRIETKNLKVPTYPYIIDTKLNHIMLGETSFNLPSQGKVQIEVFKIGYSYLSDGRFIQVSNKNVLIDIQTINNQEK